LSIQELGVKKVRPRAVVLLAEFLANAQTLRSDCAGKMYFLPASSWIMLKHFVAIVHS
jgi:hypothetical protein